jgi:hypothetical protein
VGCSVSALRRAETGERRPSGQLAELLANGLQLPAEARPVFTRVARGQLGAERLPAITSPTLKPAPLARPARPVRDRLPVHPTPLIGRERELAQLRQLLADPACRLLTLTCPGGIGKTRLAISAAREVAEAFAEGVAFVPLAPLTSARFIVPAMADALGCTFSGPAEPRLQLLHYLRDKRLLLLLDNAEHLLAEAVAERLAELREQAPRLTLLVTSREVQHLQAEWVFEVQSLPVQPRARPSTKAARWSSSCSARAAHTSALTPRPRTMRRWFTSASWLRAVRCGQV